MEEPADWHIRRPPQVCRDCGRSSYDADGGPAFDEGSQFCWECRDLRESRRMEQEGLRARIAEEDRAQVEGREFEGPTEMDSTRGNSGTWCEDCQTEMTTELLRMDQRVGYVCTNCGHQQMDHHE